ncbi:glycosyl transferase, group 2 family protein [Cyanobium sp. PCC 7001]|uniref:glycosyltransferase family 2 protein n=1 Tax=Cyanobium sp. PCC 7001 TaxID=180281 RepID=UPI0001805996|nr:glycosyltransferase family A protein [Cyanobium sp. PCC 7001]EDY39780.1 glycosyl transferase, group 2 family protein [Cyanobium sp. PCC 7001]
MSILAWPITLDVHTQLNLQGLVQRLHALPGVGHYVFVGGLDQLLLVPGQALPEACRPWLLSLESAEGLPEGDVLDGGPGEAVLGLLPVHWSRGLLTSANGVPALAELPGLANRICNLADLPWEEPCRSELSAAIRAYRLAAAAAPYGAAGLLGLLQQERRLRHRIDGRSWPGQRWRPPVDPSGWIGPDDEPSADQADQLVALVHLLPEDEQVGFAVQMAGHLRDLLTATAGEAPTQPPPPWVWSACEALIGGLNTRDLQLAAVGEGLRRHTLTAARRLEDPLLRATRLLRTLDSGSLRRDPGLVEALAAAVDTVVDQIDEASRLGDGQRRRLLQRQLAEALRGVGSNILLLKELVLQLSPASCSQLPQRQPPSACLLLLKGLLVLDRETVMALPVERQQALIQLFERLLPRVWWQAELLRVLLRDLRRFPLDGSWLSLQGGTVLEGTVRLHRYLVAPSAGADQEMELMRWQLLVLLRFTGGVKDRISLLRRLQEINPGAAGRCWQGGEESAVLEAACAGLGAHTTSLLRLWAEARQVPDLLPLAGDGSGGVRGTFERVLEHWRHSERWRSPRTGASIAVVITTFRPDLERLAQTFEALALQTLPAEEILVVDDGSPAVEAEALAQLIDLHHYGRNLPLKLLRQNSNRGQYACRNVAIAASRSELLAIQDDDDLSHPLRLERQWEALQGGKLACYAQHVRLDEATGHPQPDGDGTRAVGDGITTLMVRRSTAVELGGFYPVRSRGDVEFRERLLRRFGEGAIAWLEQPLYLMRGAPTTISSDFEYGCSLRLPTWRRLIREGYLA